MHSPAQRIADDGLVAVLRLDDPDAVLPVAEALVAGGVSILEVTATVPDALPALARLDDRFGEDDDVLLGMGSVLDAPTALEAAAAGARFIVSPVFEREVIAASHEAGAAAVPGALTPSEIQAAARAGADLVKVFPAHAVGPSYLSSVLAPMPHLNLVPTGGVGPDTAADWFAAGATAVAAGGALLDAAAVAEGRYDALTDRARTMRRRVDRARSD
jgi:2-dehydro-3-deoxyphosphogluconate aldolase/(4S)-4-hydroxy-2-oxoglutarate aldolase